MRALRHRRFESQLKQLQSAATSRGGLTTGVATAGGATVNAGTQQQRDAARQQLEAAIAKHAAGKRL